MSQRAALRQVIELLAAAAAAAHRAGLAIQSVLLDAQRAYRRQARGGKP